MFRQYYLIIIVFQEGTHHCIWYGDDKDGLMMKGQMLLWFPAREDVYTYAEQHQIKIMDEDEFVYNFASIQEWLESPSHEGIDCRAILNAWNLLGDIAYSSSRRFIGDEDTSFILRVYDMLFYGNNLPALKGDAPDYIPQWTQEDVDCIAAVMKDGLALLESLL